MATLTATPSQVEAGEAVTVVGAEFTPDATVTLSVPELGVSSEIVADKAGYFGSDDIADHATATLTASDQPTAGKVVVIHNRTYTFRSTFSTGPTVANEVKIGTDLATTLANLKKAINLTGTAGTEYSTGTTKHATVNALTLTDTTLLVYAITGGTAGNAYASTTDETNFAWDGATFVDTGSAATGISAMILDFEHPGTYTITADDGTLDPVSTTVSVFSK